jgi:hypothetical protein
MSRRGRGPRGPPKQPLWVQPRRRLHRIPVAGNWQVLEKSVLVRKFAVGKRL